MKAQAVNSSYILCPICHRGKVIAENGEADGGGICLIPPGSKRKARWYVKCGVCKSQIGILLKE